MKLVELSEIRKGQTFVTVALPSWIECRGDNRWRLHNGEWAPATEDVITAAGDKPVVLIELEDPTPDYTVAILNALKFYERENACGNQEGN